ncbi:MAG: alpha/beta hydrolase [Lautropia sp.]|nr:alpha/beta hydrolase [Lautropia sp.]
MSAHAHARPPRRPTLSVVPPAPATSGSTLSSLPAGAPPESAHTTEPAAFPTAAAMQSPAHTATSARRFADAPSDTAGKPAAHAPSTPAAQHPAPAIANSAPLPRRERPPFVEPVRLGEDESALAALFQPASGLDKAVLICPPFGQEAIRAQRSLRVVSERLARQGIPSLRFDYFGTGDSPGEDGVGHLNRWQQDIIIADSWLRKLSGCPNIIWLGLRLGATIALQAASQHPDLPQPARIVLWEPVLDGRHYLSHLARMHEFWTRQANVTTEALGFLLTTRIRRHIGHIQPDTLTPPRGSRIDLLAHAQLRGRERFLAHARHRTRVNDIRLGSTIEWTSNTALESQWVPDEALAALLSICATPDA